MSRDVAAARSYWIGSALVLGAAVLWGTSFPATAVALEAASPLSVALIRGVGQTLILGVALIVYMRRGHEFAWRAISSRGWLVIVVLGLLGSFFNVGQALSIDLSGIVVPALVAGLYPVAAVVAAALIGGESLSAGTIVGVSLAAVGVTLLADPTSLEPGYAAGLVVAGLAAISFGVYVALSRREMAREPIPPLIITLSVFVALAVQAAAGLVFASASASALPAEITGDYVEAMLWLILACGVAPLAMMELALRRTTVVRTSPYLFASALVAAIIGIVVFGEQLATVQVLGGLAAIGGIVVATRDS